jgi:pimeloyl-ACP methyl ester carboxylesterase
MGRRATADQPEPLSRLVRLEAADGVELSGLLYEPRRPDGRAIVWLHGTGGASVFDSRRTNLLAAAFTDLGFAFFPFNNRGAHLLRRLRMRRGLISKSVGGGMAYERIRDCVHDLDGAARFLRARGYRHLTVAGHSTGANKIAVYDHYKPRNPFRRYVLLAGGDDTGLLYDQLGARRYAATLIKARSMIAARRGEELVPPSISSLPMSWASWYDMANPDGDYNVFPFLEVLRRVRLSRRRRFRYVQAIRKPSLYLYGERDEYCHGDVAGCVAALAAAIGPRPNGELAILADADHGFSGHEAQLAALIAEFAGS